MNQSEKIDKDVSTVSTENYFTQAINYLPHITDKLNPDVLLYFYAHYKQATVGQCDIPKPGFLDFNGRRKWQSWKDLGDMAAEQAQMNYVNMLKKVDPTWDPKETCVQPSVSVSRLRHIGCVNGEAGVDCAASGHVSTGETAVFSAIKDNQVDTVRRLLAQEPEQAHLTDEQGMTPLHWAADRGYRDLCRLLIDYTACVNVRDKAGQTPLHYACGCGHVDVVRLLLSADGDLSIRDDNGESPEDLLDAKDRAELSL